MKSFEDASVELEGFTLEEAETVTRVYVCSQCEGELSIVASDCDNQIFDVVCFECGYIEQIGRISKTTVAIRNERGVFDYPKVIRILPDLWGHLINTKEDQKKIIKELGF